jgi:hypothetical protein
MKATHIQQYKQALADASTDTSPRNWVSIDDQQPKTGVWGHVQHKDGTISVDKYTSTRGFVNNHNAVAAWSAIASV